MKKETNPSSLETSIFIVPRGSTEWKGNEAGWITASGWASAGKELWGEALVATTDNVFEPEESRVFPIGSATNKVPKSHRSYKKTIRKFIPEFFITAIKDFKLKNSKPSVWPIENDPRLEKNNLKIVWERHDLFCGPGHKIAKKYNVPFIISVEALAVWEAKKWGVKRPFWGNWLEKNVEAKSLKNADVVCCVSEEVRNKVISMGIERDKVIVTPNRVDSTLFNPNINGTSICEKFNLKDKTVIGWTGSFRGFHAVDDIVSAFADVHKKYKNTILLLVGDGQEFSNIQKLIEEYGIGDSVIMPGRKAFIEIPEFVANFDIALVSARSAEGFHYSPLKLREYLGAGKAVIAPNAGDLPATFHNGSQVLLYEPGNSLDLSEKMLNLVENQNLRNDLSENAKKWFKEQGSWVHELKKVCDILNVDY